MLQKKLKKERKSRRRLQEHMGMVSEYPGLTETNPNDIISHSHNNMHLLSGKYKRLVLDLNHRSIMDKLRLCLESCTYFCSINVRSAQSVTAFRKYLTMSLFHCHYLA